MGAHEAATLDEDLKTSLDSDKALDCETWKHCSRKEDLAPIWGNHCSKELMKWVVCFIQFSLKSFICERKRTNREENTNIYDCTRNAFKSSGLVPVFEIDFLTSSPICCSGCTAC